MRCIARSDRRLVVDSSRVMSFRNDFRPNLTYVGARGANDELPVIRIRTILLRIETDRVQGDSVHVFIHVSEIECGILECTILCYRYIIYNTFSLNVSRTFGRG